MGSFFIHSGLAWATIGLISIPIIIHLINRRRFRRIDWAAMEFLLDALKKNRRRVRIEQLILLLLRIAIMALLGLLLARPVLSDKGFEWLSGAFRSEDKIFVLDDSHSTARREADRSVFDRLKEALSSQVRRFGERGTSDRFTLLRGSKHKTPIARAVFVDRERSLSLTQSISKLAPTDTRLPLVDILQSVAEATAREASGAARPRAVSILSDLRAVDWTNRQGGADENLTEALKRLTSSEETPTRILVLDAGTDDIDNAALTSVRVEGGKPIAEIPADLRVEVTNFGPRAVRGLGLRVRYSPAPATAGDEKAATAIGPALEEIAPGRTAVATVPCTFRTPGWYGVSVELSGARDALPGDDSVALAVEVVSGTDVLLVSGEPASEPFEGETDFLSEALSPAGELASGIRPHVVLEESIPSGDLAKYAVVFLANLHSVPSEALGALGRYVRQGGTLVIFPGDQTDAALFNRQLGREAGTVAAAKDAAPERGLLPARMGELKSQEDPVGLAPEFDHAYFRLLRDAKDLTSMVRVSKYFALEPAPTAQVIARFTDTDRSPAIVEQAADKGRVVLFATTADLEWHDWPRNPSFLMTLQELVTQSVRSRSETTQNLAGEAILVPIDIALYALQARLRTPGYPGEPEVVITASPGPESRSQASPGQVGEKAATSTSAFRFEIKDTDRAGLYALAVKTKSGDEEWRQIAVRRDAQESDLHRISAGRISELYPGIDLSVVKDAAAFSDVGRGSFEVSDFLLWTFLAFLLVEVFLARVFAHHTGTAPSAPIRAPGSATGGVAR